MTNPNYTSPWYTEIPSDIAKVTEPWASVNDVEHYGNPEQEWDPNANGGAGGYVDKGEPHVVPLLFLIKDKDGDANDPNNYILLGISNIPTDGAGIRDLDIKNNGITKNLDELSALEVRVAALEAAP